MLTIYALKQRSRDDMRNTKPSVFLAAALFIAVSFVLSLLLANLTGQTGYEKNLTSFVEKNMTELYPDASTSTNFKDYVESISAFVKGHENELSSLYPKVTAVASLIAFLVYLMSTIVTVGFDLYALKVSRHGETKITDIFSSFEFLGKTFLIIILKSIFIFLWTLLFVIPGIIAAYRYSQSFYVMYDHPEYTALQCIRASSDLMRGHKGMLFLLQLSFIGWFIVDNLVASFIIIPLFSIFVQPYFAITRARFYNAITATAATEGFEQGGGGI